MKLLEFFAKGYIWIDYDYDEDAETFCRTITVPCFTDGEEEHEEMDSDVRSEVYSRIYEFIQDDVLDTLDKERLGQSYGVLLEGKNVDEADRLNMFNKYIKYNEAFDKFCENDPISENIIDDLIEKQISILDKDFEEKDIVNAMKKYESLFDEEGNINDDFDLVSVVNDIPLYMLHAIVNAICDYYYDNLEGHLINFDFGNYNISFKFYVW